MKTCESTERVTICLGESGRAVWEGQSTAARGSHRACLCRSAGGGGGDSAHWDNPSTCACVSHTPWWPAVLPTVGVLLTLTFPSIPPTTFYFRSSILLHLVTFVVMFKHRVQIKGNCLLSSLLHLFEVQEHSGMIPGEEHTAQMTNAGLLLSLEVRVVPEDEMGSWGYGSKSHSSSFWVLCSYTEDLRWQGTPGLTWGGKRRSQRASWSRKGMEWGGRSCHCSLPGMSAQQLECGSVNIRRIWTGGRGLIF